MLLRRTHRNFLVVLLFMLVFDVWQAAVNLFAGPEAFANPGLRYVNRIDPTWWGTAFAVAGLFLALGMWRTHTFHFARIGIAIGLLTCAIRMIYLIQAGATNSTGLPTWLLVVGTHLACVMEPPSNPSTQ